MAKRAIIRLQLDNTAKVQLDRLSDTRGMTQLAVLSRLLAWFVKQDELLQASILGLLSDQQLGVIAQLLLEREKRD